MANRKTGAKAPAKGLPVVAVEHQDKRPTSLTKLERLHRQAVKKQSNQSIRTASFSTGGYGSGPSMSNTINAGSSFYSPQLSTDFLELPQSDRERRELYRFWYNRHPIVGSAIDFHTDVPMSKIRLSLPKGKDPKLNKRIHHFYMRMCKRIRLFKILHEGTHEYWLQGVANFFCEDHDLSESIPSHFLPKKNEEGEIIEDHDNPLTEEQKKDGIQKFIRENYLGWESIKILPPEQVKLEIFQYTNKTRLELIVSEKDKTLLEKAQAGDLEAARIADDIPAAIKDSLANNVNIPLSTSPYDDYLCSSFCYQLVHKKSSYDGRAVSLLERVLPTLLYQDKLRQSQTSIASRAMTPKRIVWAENLDESQVADLRDQVDSALQDPDYTIVTNYEVHWDEIGSRDRLLDLGGEYEITNRLLFIGLRITESMLTGESSYSGERIHLDVMNTMYLLYRDTVTEFVEEFLFEPVAEKKGFYEIDEFGNKEYIYPKLQFTRLALRDNSELQDFMFNLYTKGSLPISFILELLNIDSDETLEVLKKDMFSPNDAVFNEFLRQAYQSVADKIVDEYDIVEKVASSSGLKKRKKDATRFDE